MRLFSAALKIHSRSSKEESAIKTIKKQTLIAGALTVLGASVITRILGFVFRIYIADKLGAEGMGLYQLVTSLYMLVVTFATSGISIAVSRMVAEQLAANRYGSTRVILRMSVCWSLMISLAASLLLFAFANPIGCYLLGDPRTVLSLRCLAPSLPFMAASSCIKGYFYALRNSMRPSSATVIEQIAKIVFIICIIGLWLPYGDAYACAATAMGMTVGEIISCAYVMATYFSYADHKDKKVCKHRSVFGQILSISLPIQTSSTLHSALRLAENLLIINGLRIFTGGDGGAAISAYGVLKGMVLPLLMFPTSLLQAVVTVLIPEVAGANAGGRKQTVQRACGRVLQLTLLMGIIITALFLLFPEQIGSLFYHDPSVPGMLAKLSLLCPLIYLEMVTVGILNAIGEQVAPMRYNIADSLLRIVFIWLLVPKGGIDYFLWIMIGSNLFTSLLNLHHLLKVTGMRLEVANWLAKPSLAAAASGVPSLLLYRILSGFLHDWAALCLCCIVASGIYFALLFPLGCIGKKEVKWFSACLRNQSSR